MPEEKPKPSTNIGNASILVDDCYRIITTIPNAHYDLNPHIVDGTPFKFVRAFTDGQLDPYNRDFGALYINEETKEAIYVARGTFDGGPRAGYTDWDYNFYGLPTKDKCQARINDGALNVATMKALYPEYTFTVAGHSLGAYVAQGIARKMDLFGVGFNGPSFEDVAFNKFIMISNYNDLVGRLNITAPNALYIDRKVPPPVVWQDKGDIVSSAIDFVGQVFNFITSFFPKVKEFHSAKENVLDKLPEETKEVDYTKIHTPSPDNSERNKLINSTKELPGASLLLDNQNIFGEAPLPVYFPKPSIIFSDPDNNLKEWQISLKFTLPLEIPVDGFGNLFKNRIVSADGGQHETFTTEDGQTVCGIDEKGNPTVYTDNNNGTEPTPSPDNNAPAQDESQNKEGSVEFKTQSLLKKSELTSKTPFAINKEKHQIYMEQLPLKQSIRALHHTAIIPPLQLKDASGAQNMGGALGLFIKTIHPASDFYEKAVEVSGLGQIVYLSCLYGQWLKKSELAQPGDIVFIQSSFIRDTQAWGVMIEQKDEFNMDVMLVNGPTVGIGWPIAYLCTGLPMVVLKAFRPSLKPVINENSPEGKFWGPMMSYLKMLMETRNFEKPDTFLSKLLKPKGIVVASLDEFFNIYTNEIKPVTDMWGIPFGSIVFTENRLGVGVMLSNYSIHGNLVDKKEDYKQSDNYMLEDFKPAFYWLPTIKEQSK